MKKKRYYYSVYKYKNEYYIKTYFNEQKEWQFEIATDRSKSYRLKQGTIVEGTNDFLSIQDSKELIKKAILVSNKFLYSQHFYGIYIDVNTFKVQMEYKYKKAYTLKKAHAFFNMYNDFIYFVE